jgi:hypothetical protein
MLPEGTKIHYQVPRNILIWIWWRRMLLRPRRLVSVALCAVAAVLIHFAKPDFDVLVIAFICTLVVAMPFNLYRVLAKAIDENHQHTDPKTLEFSESRLILTGPDWRSELPWTTFCGFSEDASYFYLHLSDNGLASVLPKEAFSTQQQQRFRECAKSCEA